jgi:hypothetical protein
MIDTAILDHAIASHARWKSRLRQAIASGQSEYTLDQVQVDDQCEFGQWLHQLPLAERIKPRWRTLHQLHETFHKEAAHILDLATHRHQEQAEAGMKPGSSFTRVSTDLVMAINAWKNEEKSAAETL